MNNINNSYGYNYLLYEFIGAECILMKRNEVICKVHLERIAMTFDQICKIAI